MFQVRSGGVQINIPPQVWCLEAKGYDDFFLQIIGKHFLGMPVCQWMVEILEVKNHLPKKNSRAILTGRKCPLLPRRIPVSKSLPVSKIPHL